MSLTATRRVQRVQDLYRVHRLEFPFPVAYVCHALWGACYAASAPEQLFSAPVLLAVVANLIPLIAQNVLNASMDIPIDARTPGKSAVARAAMRLGRARLMGIASVEMAIALFLAGGVAVHLGRPLVAAGVAGGILVEYLYNLEPVRLKKRGLANPVSLGLHFSLLPCLSTFNAVRPGFPGFLWPLFLGLWLLLIGRTLWWSLPDAAADRAAGLAPPAVRYGRSRALHGAGAATATARAVPRKAPRHRSARRADAGRVHHGCSPRPVHVVARCGQPAQNGDRAQRDTEVLAKARVKDNSTGPDRTPGPASSPATLPPRRSSVALPGIEDPPARTAEEQGCDHGDHHQQHPGHRRGITHPEVVDPSLVEVQRVEQRGVGGAAAAAAADADAEGAGERLERMAFYRKQVVQRQWYGFWHYGDFMHTFDADRHTWRYDVGGYAWDNAELGTDAMLWYAFLRSGDPGIFRLASAMTQHVSEVDTHHSGRFAGPGSRHNVVHWGDGAKEARLGESFTKRFSMI